MGIPVRTSTCLYVLHPGLLPRARGGWHWNLGLGIWAKQAGTSALKHRNFYRASYTPLHSRNLRRGGAGVGGIGTLELGGWGLGSFHWDSVDVSVAGGVPLELGVGVSGWLHLNHREGLGVTQQYRNSGCSLTVPPLQSPTVGVSYSTYIRLRAIVQLSTPTNII